MAYEQPAKKSKTKISTKSNIGEIVRRLEDNYINGTTTISKYVVKSMYDDLQKIDAYLNSKHTSGETDSQDRDKPFFNIVTAAVNIWYRATDLDRKDIKIRATKIKDTFTSFLATVHLQDWMRRARFGYFLNDWGRTLARYGSAVVKFVEQDGELKAIVSPWNRMICDVVDFDSNPKIEILELTEAQLYEKKGYDRDIVEKLCETKAARTLISQEQQDNNNDYIKLYEVHGYLPLSYLTGKVKDENTYQQQMHVISYVAGKEKGSFDDFTLYSGKEDKDPYMITHLIKEDGQSLSIGAVQHLFDAQWMMNHTAKMIKDQLDLASKLIFQTSDGTFAGRNALTAIENGDILVHKVNEPLTQINNGSHDITAAQSFASQWKALGNEINGISESMLGQTAPSGTPWRQIDALLQENHSLFELMTENKGLHVEDMLRSYVIPHLKKKMDTTKEIVATLEDHDIRKVDKIFVNNEAIKRTNQALVHAVLHMDEMPTQEEQAQVMGQNMANIQEAQNTLGNIRSFTPGDEPDATWKKAFKDLEWDAEVDITHESSSAKDDGTTLATVFQTIADPNKRAVLQTPEGKMLFNKILNTYGSVSPLELSTISPISSPQTPQPAPAPAGAWNRWGGLLV